jgi:hypothetical protein
MSLKAIRDDNLETKATRCLVSECIYLATHKICTNSAFSRYTKFVSSLEENATTGNPCKRHLRFFASP